jgi:GNAT superfamily N-acetyltransferase
MNNLKYIKRIPTVKEFLALRKDAGWGVPPESIASEALGKTIFSICVESNNETIGMGRVVGDGELQIFITDVIINKNYQKQGIGTVIMEIIMEYIEEHISPFAFVGLFSAFGRDNFYQKFDFIVRPNNSFGPGMMFYKNKKNE